MNKLKIILISLLLSPAFVQAALIDIDTSYDLTNGLISTYALDNGPVSIANGDSVDLTVNFLDGLALTIEDGNESFRGWLTAGDNESSFTISNIQFELLGFSGSNGVSSVYNLGSQTDGQAHIGATLSDFLTAGQSATFSGFRVNFDVDSISTSPHNYANLWMVVFGDNLSVGPAPKIPEPSALALLGLGLFAFRLSRKK